MKHTFILLMFMFLSYSCFSQENYINKKWKIKAASSSNKTAVIAGNSNEYKKADNYQLELSYGLQNYLELGFYGGYSLNTGVLSNLTNITYGFNINLHILPFITKGKILKFVDTYVTANWGSHFYKIDIGDNIGGYGNLGKEKPPIRIKRESYIAEHGLGLGAAIYPLEKLGIFTEFVFGTYFYQDNKRFRTGLIYRF